MSCSEVVVARRRSISVKDGPRIVGLFTVKDCVGFREIHFDIQLRV